MKVLFICTGNTCRSPMAEGILRDLAKRENLNIQVKSAGTHGVDGFGPAYNGILAMDNIGIDIKEHKTTLVNNKLMEEADLILTMSKSHKDYLFYNYPKMRDKIFLINEYAYGMDKDIEDPYGGSLKYYERARDEIYRGVLEVLNKIK